MKNITVIKFGGSLTKNKEAQKKFIKDLAQISKKQNIVLVHGGGPEINNLLERLSIKSKFINGLRYTDEKTLEVVEMALSGKVNKMLTAELIKCGVKACGISAKDGSIAVCKVKKELGFAGEPVKINVKLIETLIKGGFFPVISSVGIDKNAHAVNINADTLATNIAVNFKADKLIFLTDVAGVLDKNKKTIKNIKIKQVNNLITDEVITGGMIPKIKSAVSAVKKGVKQVLIIDGNAGIKQLKGTVISK
ncbi:acetylglutamate kinase [Candidatus Ruminimicrobium bovinum]|uniref:acetylglutamate kinase n=1 Tax=Candidatus Ruminimicrobium bovinum TaxID=3242779 RepID=UPI0039B970C2